VDRQPTAVLRQVGRAVYLLGVGAGLDGRWLTAIGAEQVDTAWSAVVVAVPSPQERIVPVLAPFAARLLELAAQVGSGSLSGLNTDSKNALSDAMKRLKVPPGTPQLSARRLRSTWLRMHLERRTRLPELATAAGLEGLTVLTDLLPELARLPHPEYCRELTGHEADDRSREELDADRSGP
jgi:hypothetical protein